MRPLPHLAVVGGWLPWCGGRRALQPSFNGGAEDVVLDEVVDGARIGQRSDEPSNMD